MKSTIVFRVDSSLQIGSGHLMRCLTLAEKIAAKFNIIFICRDLEGNLSNLIQDIGYKLYLLPKTTENQADLQGYEQWLTVSQETDAHQTLAILENLADIQWIIIDHYAIDEVWENKVREKTRKIFVIDDLANRQHNCDVLLDQNCNSPDRYNTLVPAHCKMLLGSAYALLRSEFYNAKNKLPLHNNDIKNILIFLGGSDLSNETAKALKALIPLAPYNLLINVVVGHSNPHKEYIYNLSSKHTNINYHCQITNISELMIEADIAIGAGGSTTLERCFLELPSLVIIVADNQTEPTLAAYNQGLILDYMFSAQTTAKAIQAKILHYIKNPVLVQSVRNNCKENMQANFDYQTLFCERI